MYSSKTFSFLDITFVCKLIKSLEFSVLFSFGNLCKLDMHPLGAIPTNSVLFRLLRSSLLCSLFALLFLFWRSTPRKTPAPEDLLRLPISVIGLDIYEDSTALFFSTELGIVRSFVSERAFSWPTERYRTGRAQVEWRKWKILERGLKWSFDHAEGNKYLSVVLL